MSEITRYNKMFDQFSMHVKKSSTEEEVEESPEEYVLKWFTPFGNQYLGDMVGTEMFPAL